MCVVKDVYVPVPIPLRGTAPLTSFVTVYAFFFQKLQHIDNK